MPRLFIIMRFTTKTDQKPMYNTTDVTMRGISRGLNDDTSRHFALYEVENENLQDGQPARYLTAVDIARDEADNLNIPCGTLSHEDARFRFARLPEQIVESDQERIRGDESNRDKGVIRLEGNTGIRVTMRPNSFLWYELVTIYTYAFEVWVAEEKANKDANELWRLNVEEAVGEDVGMLDDVEEETESS